MIKFSAFHNVILCRPNRRQLYTYVTKKLYTRTYLHGNLSTSRTILWPPDNETRCGTCKTIAWELID